MAGDEADLGHEIELALALEHAQDGEADGHQGRLGVLGQGQGLDRPFEHQAAERLLERLIDLFKDVAGRAKGPGEILAHAHRLGALPRKYKDLLH